MGALLTPGQRAAAHAISSLTLYESSFKLEWMSDPWEDIDRAEQWLLELEADVQPAIVHLTRFHK